MARKRSGAEALYIDLVKQSLTGALSGHGRRAIRPTSTSKRLLRNALRGVGLELYRTSAVDPAALADGSDWVEDCLTMIGFARLDNLQACMEDVVDKQIPGDFIETGVWRGGATILMRAVLKALGITDRFVYVADSFEGLPAPDVTRHPADAGDVLHTMDLFAVPLNAVRSNFDRYGLLDDQVKFVEGFFRDTLPELRDHQWAVIRLDGDLYESTMDALVNLYPGLSPGGWLIVDDYGHVPACAEAVNEYREKQNITETLERVDRCGVCWQKRKPMILANAPPELRESFL